jgi:heme-degrading monooxygenase HmoA
MAAFHLAQLNIGRLQAPMGTPQLAPFEEALEPLNALADRSPGFVWRLQTEEGDATALRPFEDDDMMLVNMSVWESLDALKAYAYGPEHRAILQRRREFFERMSGPYLVLWWVPAGHVPTVEEAKERLQRLEDIGPSPEAFTFRKPFPPPDQPDGESPSAEMAAGAGEPAALTPPTTSSDQ